MSDPLLHTRLSTIFKKLDTSKALSLGELAKAMGERAIGALLFIFALPNAIPTPPGTSAVLGLPLIIFAAQIVAGRQSLWLPKSIANREVSAALLSTFTAKAVPLLERLEKVLKPRFEIIINNDLAERLLGLACLVLAIILFLPIPFGNIVPAIAISVLALALVERDGIAAIIGYAMAAASVLLLVALSSVIWTTIASSLSYFGF